MKKIIILLLVLCGFCPLITHAQSDGLPRGAYQMPYTRYEANAAAVGGGATMLAATFDQKQTQSEASDQTCASLNATNSFVKWNLTSAGQGLVLRFSIPDNAAGTGQTGTLALFVGGTFVQNINLSSKWAWQYFSPNPSDGTKDPVNTPQSGWTMRMRFDEVRVKLPSSVSSGTEVRLVKQASDGINYLVDFIEMEPIPAAVAQPANAVSVTSFGAVPNDANDDKQAFVSAIAEARNTGKSIYVPEGRFLLNSKLDMINISNVTLQGAGMWLTELYFTGTSSGGGGISSGGTGMNIDMKDFFMNTDNTSRTSDYKGFVGGHGTNSSIERVWVEHFEVGLWEANFFGTPVTDGLLVTNCRFRNNYADGVNFSRGTSNSICEHSNMRNNGDDAMASWSSNDGPQQCVNNEFRYCTAENTWRAGGIGFFGGGGHKGHHLLIKDGVENGIRVNSDFPTVGSSFSTTLWMEISETTVISCGTNANLWYNRYGAIDIFTRLYDVQNLRLRNVDVLNSQKDGAMIYNVGTAFKITNLEFINVTIDGTGKDNNVNNYTTGTWDDYKGYGIYVLPGTPGTNGSMTTTGLVVNAASTPAINNESPATFTINNVGNTSVASVAISPASALSIPQGGTSQLTAVISPTNATNQNVAWTSSNTAVATVSAAGVVTGVAPGTATITVTTQDGSKAATKSVTVTAAVNITATDATAGEGGNVGVYTISTSGTTSNLTIGYTISGTASTSDYSSSPALSGSVTLTSAAPSATITITPTEDTVFEGSETLIVTLQPGTGYSLGGSTAATINIADNDNPPCTAPVIGFTTTAPDIDQSIDAAWGNVPAGTLGNVTIGSMPSDFAGSKWRAMYDNTNLYLLVEVKDANRLNDSGASWWEDDVVEIFIDGNNSKGSSYDGVDDFQLGFRYNDTGIKVGGTSVTRTTGIVFAQHNVSNGYNIEVRIPWSTIGVTPGLGNKIGLEVEVDDDDNGGTRDSQVSAFATTSTAWSTPSVFDTLFLTTCGTQPNVPVTGVSVSPLPSTACLGGTVQLTATVAPENATNQNVTWSSGNTSVATVNTSGIITAVAAGTAVITVTTADGAKTATSTITVNTCNVSVTGVTVSPASATLPVGAAQQLTATVAPSNATNKNVTWSTSNASFATVSSSGLVTAVGAGTATITVTTAEGAKTATSSITVTTGNVAVTGITVSPASVSLTTGATQQLTTTVSPANATNKTVTYSSNNTGVATVNGSGLLTAVSSGSAIITVTTQDGAKTATVAITVNTSNVAVTSVSLSPTSVTLAVGETQQLTPTILPSNASNKSVSYASNNTAVATVNGSGLLTAVSNGTATITVTTADGNKTSTAAITVATATGSYFTIKNKWTNTYLFDAGANVGYGATVANNNYKWEKVAVDATYFLLKNVATGDVMHIENLTGSVQCTAGSSSWMSTQWSNENVDGTWVRIRNRWQTGAMIHVENQTGSAQYNGGQNNWDSAQWQFQSSTTAKGSNQKLEATTENNVLIGIYPNPATNNEFNIVLPELRAGDLATITVTDINGKKVLVNKLNSSAKISHNLIAGIYIVTIISEEYHVTKKLIIK
jgi:uncharacterized protein YjdB